MHVSPRPFVLDMTTATKPLLLALRSTLLAAVACLGFAAQVRASPEILVATVPDAQVALFQRDICGTTEAEFETPQRAEKRGHIFVSIASYRDQACKRTIADLFAKAAHPERITVGVVQQNQAGSAEDCIAGCALCAEKQRLGQMIMTTPKPAVRWLHLYAPVRPVISHEYHRARTLRFFERANELQTCRARAVTRAQYLLGVITRDDVDPTFRAGLDRYGVGHARSLADYYAYAGLENPGLTLIDDLGSTRFDWWAGGPLAAAVPMGDSAPVITYRCRRPPAAKMSGRP